MKQLLLTSIALIVCNIANAQIFQLSSYEMDIYPCSHPKHGFIKTDFSQYHAKSIDSFVIDLDKNKFSWKDAKGSSKNEIYKATKDENKITFATDYNAVQVTKITGEKYIIDIIYLDGSDWYMASFQCKINN